jgi:hypothetical protein
LLLDPRRYRRKSSSSGIGASFRVSDPLKYRHYWFCDPAVPLAPCLGCAVFLQWAAAGDCLGFRLHPLFEFALPLEFYPATPTRPPQRSGPLMGFASLQHLRSPRSTGRGPSLPATFRLQGLTTLLAVFALGVRAGFVSHRQRSWDSPFGGFLSRKVSAAFRPERTHLSSARQCFRRRSAGPARRASISGFRPPESALRPRGVLIRRSPAAPLGFAPLG